MQWVLCKYQSIRGCIRKFPDWPPGARTANSTALCHYVQLYRYFVSQSSEFCRHNPLCCFSTIVYFCCCLFRYDSVRKLLDIPSYNVYRVYILIIFTTFMKGIFSDMNTQWDASKNRLTRIRKVSLKMTYSEWKLHTIRIKRNAARMKKWLDTKTDGNTT
jgi:hypothetical protein